ncbi:MAG: DUF1844 domain-containing protein [Desulfovibrionaceae bacterium]|nr:DUF1844 domain-containing protein [Desulfovibrionaceae bacterium]MDD4952069.1 DUF1844 domain-containing protein [Desulfovibrionaceae bacterium]
MSQDSKCSCGKDSMQGMPLPEVTFSSFILSLSSSALVLLGETPDPESGRIEPRPHLAKQTIDILGMLQDKCEKGLNSEEKKLLCDLLYNLRMKYVNKVK